MVIARYDHDFDVTSWISKGHPRAADVPRRLTSFPRNNFSPLRHGENALDQTELPRKYSLVG